MLLKKTTSSYPDPLMKNIIASLLLATSLYGQEKVELYTNFGADIGYYNSFMKDQDVEVVGTYCEKYGKAFEKKNTIFSKWVRKLSLDYPKKIDSDADKIVWMNIPNHFYRDHFVGKLPKEKMVLFMWEPYIRLRKMYNKNLHRCFSKIYTWDDDLVDNKLYFKFYYPVLQPMIEKIVPFEEKKFCTLVSGYAFGSDKYPRKYPNELYSHRMKAIEFFEKVGEEGFEFYGKGWPVNFKSFRGACSDKIEVIKNFKFSICYENCRDTKGYISEKIFDCFQAGNLPVYWGASNVTDFIPKECFIDRRDFETLDELYVFLKAMTAEEYNGYIERIAAYLKSDKAQLFSQENYQRIFAEAVKQ